MLQTNRDFVDYYIHLFEILSRLGTFPVKWSESLSKFVPANRITLIIFRVLSLIVGVEFIFLSLRLYWLLYQTETYVTEDLIFLEVWITFNIISAGILFAIVFRMDAALQSISGLVSNLAQLHELLKISIKEDVVRKDLVWYTFCYIPGFFVSVVAISYEFYVHPLRLNFIFSVMPGAMTDSTVLWTLYWVYEILLQHIYWSLVAFLGIYTRIVGLTAIHGMKMLSPTSTEIPAARYVVAPGNVNFRTACGWFRSYYLTLGVVNKFMKHIVVISCILITIGFCLAMYAILKVPNLSLLSYGLLFVMSNFNFWFPFLACLALGMIPPSILGFTQQWRLMAKSLPERKTVDSFRVTGILASGLWTMSLPMFLDNADESMNWIICVLISY